MNLDLNLRGPHSSVNIYPRRVSWPVSHRASDRGAPMIRGWLWASAVALIVLGSSATVFAQSRGRTDGPEGSEYGKGGYRRLGGEEFSLAVEWGAAIESDSGYSGTPMFVGGTMSYWGTEWFLIDLSGNYLFSSKKVDILLGPRFRTATWPVSFNVGFKAGPIFLPDNRVRFGIAPQAGFDLLLERHLILGISYAPDIPLGDGGGVSHRIFMTIGYRF